MSTLQRLIAPYPSDRFASDIWEQAHLHVARDDPRYFDWLFRLQDLDELLCRDNLRFPAVQVFLNGEQLGASQFTRAWHYGRGSHSDLIDIDRVYELFDQGCTINILALDRLWSTVGAMNRGLETDLGYPVHTTAFLTPKAADNIPPHYDMVDVFALQISGTKRWRLWSSNTGLPLVGERRRTYDLDDPAVGEDRVIDEVELKPGDSLFLPRGLIHQALTTEKHSLHITVGINPSRHWEAVQLLCERALSRLAFEQDARRALPPGLCREDIAVQQTDRERVTRLIAAFAREVEAQRGGALNALESRSVSGRYPARPGQLIERARVTCDTVVRRRAGLLSRSTVQNGQLWLEFHDKFLSFGLSLAPLFDVVEKKASFAPADLPGGLSLDEKCAFVERLLNEGYLEIKS